jgi:truncated hemoglobin YjbI
MSFMDDIGGKSALIKAVHDFFHRTSEDEQVKTAFEGLDATTMAEEQVDAISAFLDDDEDGFAAKLRAAFRPMEDRGLSDDQFDTLYDHFHDAMIELGLPGGMVHEMLDKFEDLREHLVK